MAFTTEFRIYSLYTTSQQGQGKYGYLTEVGDIQANFKTLQEAEDWIDANGYRNKLYTILKVYSGTKED